MDAFLEDVEQGLVPTDRGDLSIDLQHHLVRLTKLLAISDTGAVFRALVAEAQRTRDLIPLEKAVKHGELSRDFGIEAAAEELLSPIYYRVLVSGQPISPSYVKGLVRRLLTK